jgi:hypothetical protein
MGRGIAQENTAIGLGPLFLVGESPITADLPPNSELYAVVLAAQNFPIKKAPSENGAFNIKKQSSHSESV